MVVNEQEAKVRKRYRLSPEQSIKDIPVSSERIFYIILLDFGWNTSNAEVVLRNKRVLGDKIGEHILVELTTEEQRKYFCNLFDIKKRAGPFLAICGSHPKDLKNKNSSEAKGVIVDLGKIDETEIVPLFQEIVNTIGQPSFVKAVKWRYRLRVLKKKLKGKGLLNIVSYLLKM